MLFNSIDDLIAAINSGALDEKFTALYGQTEAPQRRYIALAERFAEDFGSQRKVCLVSAPGRTEIGGNHTDHQHGRVLAAAVNLDVIAVASANDDNIMRIHSEGYKPDFIDLSDLTVQENEREKAASLIRGVAARIRETGFKIGGLDAVTTSDVLKGSGLSSSAAFEVLCAGAQNYLYNDGSIDPVDIAKISQYAENVFFGKPSGLMDQTASSVGGFVAIDFNDPANPVIENVAFDFSEAAHSLCIVDAGGNHADLTSEYAAVTFEMKNISEYFGKEVLRDVSERDFYVNIKNLREKFGDRAVLRAMHFFADSKRAADERDALKNGDFAEFLRLISQSGLSSSTMLQNIYSVTDVREQGISLALALSGQILNGRGACRVHGGGFGGTIQAFVPDDLVSEYKKKIEAVFGENSCHILKIRQSGGIML